MNSDGSLSVNTGPSGEMSYHFVPNTVEAKRGDPKFYSMDVTDPASKPFEVTGSLVLHLVATIDQSDGDWFVFLRDEAPDGSTYLLTRGCLRASHRALDPARTKPYRPWHPHGLVVRMPGPVGLGAPGVEGTVGGTQAPPGEEIGRAVRGLVLQEHEPVAVGLVDGGDEVEHEGPRHLEGFGGGIGPPDELGLALLGLHSVGHKMGAHLPRGAGVRGEAAVRVEGELGPIRAR